MFVAAGLRHVAIVRQAGVHNQLAVAFVHSLDIAGIQWQQRVADDVMELVVFHDAGAEAEIAFAATVRLHRHGPLLLVERNAQGLELPLSLIDVANRHRVTQTAADREDQRFAKSLRH